MTSKCPFYRKYCIIVYIHEAFKACQRKRTQYTCLTTQCGVLCIIVLA